MNIKHYFFIICLIFFDQTTKLLATLKLDFYEPFTIINSVLSFQLVHNYGAAYGILQHQRVLLTVVGLFVVIGSIVCQKWIIQTVWSRYGLVFLIAGALGNLIDRMRLGYVVDFVDIRIFPVFNVADVLIDIAIVLFLIELFHDYKRKKIT